MSEKLANGSDEGSTVGKTLVGYDVAKLQGSSGVRLPTAPEQ